MAQDLNFGVVVARGLDQRIEAALRADFGDLFDRFRRGRRGPGSSAVPASLGMALEPALAISRTSLGRSRRWAAARNSDARSGQNQGGSHAGRMTSNC